MGIYVLDGTARNCTATQDTSTRAGYTYLTISLKTTPQPSRGPEALVLSFYKPVGQPASAYQTTPVGGLVFYPDASGQGEVFNVWSANLLPTASGGVSSGFHGRLLDYNTGISVHTISSGAFYDVRP